MGDALLAKLQSLANAGGEACIGETPMIPLHRDTLIALVDDLERVQNKAGVARNMVVDAYYAAHTTGIILRTLQKRFEGLIDQEALDLIGLYAVTCEQGARRAEQAVDILSALAAATQRPKTPTAAECEASQSGPNESEGNAHD